MMDKNLIPKSECLKDTVDRVLPYWYDVIVPEIKVTGTASLINVTFLLTDFLIDVF